MRHDPPAPSADPAARRALASPPRENARPRGGRAIALGVVAVLAAFGMTSSPAVESEAEAGTKTGAFTVQTTLQAGCTFLINNMIFPDYTSGQSAIDNGTSSFVVSCSSASGTNNGPISYTVTATGGYKLAHGASTLNYKLCFDAGCTQPMPNGTATAILINKATYNQPYYGQIAGGQVGATGLYTQTVTATMNF